MRLKVSRSKNSASLYVIKTVYEGKKERTVTVEKLGTETELTEKLGGADPYEWAKQYIEELNLKEKENNRKVLIPYAPQKQIQRDVQRTFNGGYLFLQKIYHQLNMHNICKEISTRHKFQYNLDAILSRLVYARILFPASKRATCELSNRFIEAPDFEEHQIYRALDVIAREGDFIQAQIYQNSIASFPRNTKVLFYDCTNFFFEIEQEEGLKQYAKSKENRPNPVVQMGLFMDGNGIPLAFQITRGNANEQTTLQPLEKKILSDFNLSKFIVCTDAGLSSTANRKFNNKQGRSFITTQSIKKLKGHLKEWALAPTGWRIVERETIDPLTGKPVAIDISSVKDYRAKKRGTLKNKDEQEIWEEKHNQLHTITFYKERWINEDGFEQKLIVTYSLKYSDYQSKIRDKQIERAEKLIKQSPGKIKKKGTNDYRRFAEQKTCTEDGEACEHEFYQLNQTLIEEEEQYDGFYAVCTNLEDCVADIVAVNKGRWEIEESFRIMKSDLKSRPVFLSLDDRIEAHFTTCFISLLLYRLLEKTLNQELNKKEVKEQKETYTCTEIIQTLREMNFHRIDYEGYVPLYQRTSLTDALHDTFELRTDYEIVTDKYMKKILKETKQ